MESTWTYGSRKPITPKRAILLREALELVNPISGTVDEELVKQYFWKQNADLILSITVHEARENIIAWHYDTRDIFLWRAHTRYTARTYQGIVKEETQANTSMTVIWRQLWKLQIPKKIIHFLWRFGHNSHRLQANLKHWKMKLDTKYLVRNRFDEDGGHLYFKCKGIRGIWDALKLQDVRGRLEKIGSEKIQSKLSYPWRNKIG
jgi:hypothetical protein